MARLRSAPPAEAAAAEVRIDKVVAGGDGLARFDDGRVVFVPGALPGERVRISVASAGRDFARAQLVEVLEPHAGRVEPPCPYVAVGCGGCSWQHVALPIQRDLKRTIVVESLSRVGHVADPDVVLGPALAGDGFRTTLRLAVDASGRAGLRARASHDVVALDTCYVAHPLLADVLPHVRVDGAGGDGEVVLRAGVATGEVAAALVDVPPRATLRVPEHVVTGAKAVVHEDVDGVRFRISMGSFFQSRADGAAALVAEVRTALGDWPARLVDAYGGVGLFSATVGAASEVVLIEASGSACADARQNVIGNAAIVRAPVERWVPHGADAVIADPPRTGLGKVGASVLAATGAPVLVLVSCDPASLGRDAALLTAHGYVHLRSVVVDLFPHTAHVEVVSRFERSVAAS